MSRHTQRIDKLRFAPLRLAAAVIALGVASFLPWGGVAFAGDLSVTKTDAPDPVDAGSNITYTVTVANSGAGDITAVTLTDAVPGGTTFVSLTAPPGWGCTTPAVGGTGTVTCTRPTLTSGASEVFTLVVNVNSTTGSTVSNTASATGTGETGGNTANNSDTETTAVNFADLSVSKTDSPDPVAAGSNITYTIAVNNTGGLAAAAATLQDAIPTDTTFVSLISPPGWACATPAVGGTGTVNCSNPSLASGATATFTLVVNVNAGTTAAISNTVAVDSTSPDPDLADRSATATTAISPPAGSGAPNLSVESFTDSPDPTSVGSNTTFTAVVKNLGPGTSTDTRINLKFDPTWSFVSGNFSNGTSGTCTFESAASRGTQLSRVRCEVGSMAPNDTKTATAVMQPTQPGTFQSKAKAKAKAETDPDLSNNVGVQQTTVNGNASSTRRR